MTSVRYLLAAALIAACATAAAAQGNQDLSQVQIKPTKVTDKFYTLEGQGGMCCVGNRCSAEPSTLHENIRVRC